MDKFHDPIPRSSQILEKRKLRYKEVMRACYRGIVVRGAIITAELIGYLWTNSQALWLDAISTSLDICFSFFLVGSIKYASRPPDENHPFGHGRFEPIAGFQLSLILVVLGALLGFDQLKGSMEPDSRVFPAYTYLIPLFGAVLMELCYRLFMRAAKKAHSAALIADAYHFRSDALSNAIATLALTIGCFMPSVAGVFDHVGALCIALLMLITGLRSSKENLYQLLDKKPSEAYLAKITQAALKVREVKGVEKLKVQRYGPDAHVGIDIEVDPELSVMKAHRIAQLTRASIQEHLPEVQDVIVHVEPYFEDDH